MKKISICIPAYKRPGNVRRLLQSIAIQTFTDFEVILTDDSPDSSVKEVVDTFIAFPIHYKKNDPAKGTPANWNEGISLAQGEWIKIMHDDDWFASPSSLQEFADLTASGHHFIFSRYTNIDESGKTEQPPLPEDSKKRILKEPVTLLARNVIGPPSVTLIHHSIKERYDTSMKWRVDIDYYIRLLREQPSFGLVEIAAINVGVSQSQVTNDCKDVPGVELPEGLLLLHKYGTKPLRHMLVYDAWWRILRNTGMRSREQLVAYTPYQEWPNIIFRMIAHQRWVPASWLRFGPLSKTLMLLSYLLNQSQLPRQ